MPSGERSIIGSVWSRAGWTERQAFALDGRPGEAVTARGDGLINDDPAAGTVAFDDLYDQPDPRAYFRTLATLDYQTPEHARHLFSYLARTRSDRAGRGRRGVLDLCCSYGINAALLNHDLTLGDLYARYRSPDLDGRSRDERISADRAFYGAHRRPDAVPVIGLDVAATAVDYALEAGLLDAGICENLEEHDPSDQLRRHLADVGLITVTGGLSYITGATFDRLLGAVTADEPPWIAAFTLRGVDMASIGAVVARHGLMLEALRGRTFRQRRFASVDERRHTFAQLRRLGLDPDGVETDGYHHTVLHVARPREVAAALTLDEVLAPGLGEHDSRRGPARGSDRRQ